MVDFLIFCYRYSKGLLRSVYELLQLKMKKMERRRQPKIIVTFFYKIHRGALGSSSVACGIKQAAM